MPLSHQSPQDSSLLAGVLESAMDAIITVDAGQCIVMYNLAAEKIFGWSVAEMLGQSMDLLIPPRYRQSHPAHVQRFGATGVTSRRMGGSAVVYGLHKTRGEFPLDASISQLDTPKGKLYTVILRDVTERVRAQEELSAYAAAASAIREQEKTRVARELHDELAQSLTAIKMDTIWLRDRLAGADPDVEARINDMLGMIDSSVASTRRIAADLRPLLLDDLGLAPAIEWLAQNFTQRHGIACELQMDESLELPEPWATGVFRIVQESLVNVAKHSGASRVALRVAIEGAGSGQQELVLSVVDDGRGFDVHAPRPEGSLGLAGLRERVQLLKGTVGIESTPGSGALGAGTQVRARIPVGQAGQGA